MTKRLFELYEDVGGSWRWRCLATNGKIVSVSGESFDSRKNARRAAKKEASLHLPGVASVIGDKG